ncbi:IclR family transcriptional regulator [Nocardia sp. FBN12]|uniref:IclR family transcriptional regulator n=1 Tax=Nocardia sp. FBN12 TaxID=3419766 RepID=UPI003D08D346
MNAGEDVATENAARVLHVLETLAGMEQPASLLAIAGACDLPKMKTFRALQALQHRGYIDHTGRSGYRIGTRSVALGSLIGPRPALQQYARPVLKRLATATGEPVALHLRSGSHRVLILAVTPRGEIPAGFPVIVPLGERSPLTSGCSGTAILAYLPAAEAEHIIESRSRGTRRPTVRQLDRVRADGFAMSFEENHQGMNGIGAPVLDPLDSSPLGSLTVAGSATHLNERVLRSFAPDLIRACADLAPQMARLLGPNASAPYPALNVSVQHLLDDV